MRYLEQALKWYPGVEGYICCKVDSGRFRSLEAVGYYSTLHASCKGLIKGLCNVSAAASSLELFVVGVDDDEEVDLDA
jgi:hypothetical protein